MTPNWRRGSVIHFPSSMQQFEIRELVPKETPIRYAHSVGTEFSFTSPIDLQPNDHVWVDIRVGKLEIIERRGFTIWRAGWLN